MSINIIQLKEIQRDNLEKAIQLFQSSVNDVDDFDVNKKYTHKELVPYDALTNRCMRVYEMAIKYFDCIDKIDSKHNAETFRDLIHNACKFLLVNNEEVWFDMKKIRNKMAHEYLPNEMKNMYDFITSSFTQEVNYLYKKIS
jgi:hypothetical protein